MKLPDRLLICTVIFYYVGELQEYDDSLIKLKNASWVVNTGRLSECLNSGSLTEVETPKDGVAYINRESIICIWEWKHKLPS